jgi:hypothetical protein
MKLIGEYLGYARQLERMAAEETNRELKQAMEDQAEAYHKLAATRARELGLAAARDKAIGDPYPVATSSGS